MYAAHSKNHAGTAAIYLLAAALLYVLSWPPIEIKYVLLHWSEYNGVPTPHSPDDFLDPPQLTASATRSRLTIAVDCFYYPLCVLRDSNAGRNPFGWYWNWWVHRM
jgi:hypothetical protein